MKDIILSTVYIKEIKAFTKGNKMKIGDKIYHIRRDYDWWIDNGWMVDNRDWHVKSFVFDNNGFKISIKSGEYELHADINDVFIDFDSAKTICKLRNEKINEILIGDANDERRT